jgi:hypothetical protein
MSKEIALAASYLAIKSSSYCKTSSLVTRELDVRSLSVFGEGILRFGSHTKKGLLVKKLKEIYQGFQKAPNLWQIFKDKLGITAGIDMYWQLSKKFQVLLDRGKDWWRATANKLKKKSKLIHFLFLYASDAPTFTSIVQSIINKYGGYTGKLWKWVASFVKPITGKSRNIGEWLDNFAKKHPLLKLITWPAKAYIFWFIWINVSEISWKITDILTGLLGMIDWVDLIDSLPESGLGLVFGILFPSVPSGWILKSLSIGWNAILVPAFAFQLYALYTKNLVDEYGKPKVHLDGGLV